MREWEGRARGLKGMQPGITLLAHLLWFRSLGSSLPPHTGGPTLFRNLEFGLDLESRFAIVGPNGIGK